MNIMSGKVILTTDEYKLLLRSGSELAVLSGSERMMVYYASLYLAMIATGVTNGDDELNLCHQDDRGYYISALQLLREAKDLKKR